MECRRMISKQFRKETDVRQMCGGMQVECGFGRGKKPKKEGE